MKPLVQRIQEIGRDNKTPGLKPLTSQQTSAVMKAVGEQPTSEDARLVLEWLDEHMNQREAACQSGSLAPVQEWVYRTMPLSAIRNLATPRAEVRELVDEDGTPISALVSVLATTDTSLERIKLANRILAALGASHD